MTALHYLCRKRDKGFADHFFWSLATGETPEEGNPILVLRNSLTVKSTKKLVRRVIRDEHKAPMVILAWNLLRKDHRVMLKNAQRIAWHARMGQKYPVII